MISRKLALLALAGMLLDTGCGSDPTEDSGPPEPTTGALELTVSTTGHDLDPNGYTLSIDEGTPTAVPANGTVTHDDLLPGAHALSLADLDENCAPQEQVPFSFSITAGVQTKVTLHVTCDFANTMAFIQRETLYVTSAEPGAVPRQIGHGYYQVSWSPDGSTLALHDISTLYLADAGGGNVRVVYRQGSNAFFSDMVWSPDGTSLLLEEHNTHMTYFMFRLRLDHAADSVDVLRFDPRCSGSEHRGNASWSPDGRRFVVDGESFFTPMICIFSAEGSLERALAPGDWPAWSPDGSRIAFAGVETPGDFHHTIHTIAPDGTDERNLSTATSFGAGEQWPDWSPDSEGLSFLIALPSDSNAPLYELWVMDPVGGNRRRLVPEVTGYGKDVAWSRDGSRLAFLLRTGQLAVINRDGTGLTPVTPAGAEVTSWSWRP
jgi:hypothetical protein